MFVPKLLVINGLGIFFFVYNKSFYDIIDNMKTEQETKNGRIENENGQRNL
jgi:hypothetical protein